MREREKGILSLVVWRVKVFGFGGCFAAYAIWKKEALAWALVLYIAQIAWAAFGILQGLSNR